MANITTASRAPSAAEKVFRTFDLAEDIILRLEGRDIFVIQRVCHAINNTIADSNRPQRKLFLKADNRVIGRIRNSMLTLPPSDTVTSTLTIIEVKDDHVAPLAANSKNGYWEGKTLLVKFGGEDGVSFSRFPKPGSCLKMFITQPPMTDVLLWTHGVYGQANVLSPDWSRYNVGRAIGYARVENKDGVTWGDVFKALDKPNMALDEPWPMHLRDGGRVAAGAAIARKEKKRRGRYF